MIKQIIFDSVDLLTIDEKNTIVYNYMSSIKSINELSKELGIDRLIIRRFISEYQRRLRDKA
jgi:transposase-like protein